MTMVEPFETPVGLSRFPRRFICSLIVAHSHICTFHWYNCSHSRSMLWCDACERVRVAGVFYYMFCIMSRCELNDLLIIAFAPTIQAITEHLSSEGVATLSSEQKEFRYICGQVYQESTADESLGRPCFLSNFYIVVGLTRILVLQYFFFLFIIVLGRMSSRVFVSVVVDEQHFCFRS